MEFKMTDFESMREWLKTLEGSSKIRLLRLNLFDYYRYCEDYEALYILIKDLGGEII